MGFNSQSCLNYMKYDLMHAQPSSSRFHCWRGHIHHSLSDFFLSFCLLQNSPISLFSHSLSDRGIHLLLWKYVESDTLVPYYTSKHISWLLSLDLLQQCLVVKVYRNPLKYSCITAKNPKGPNRYFNNEKILFQINITNIFRFQYLQSKNGQYMLHHMAYLHLHVTHCMPF